MAAGALKGITVEIGGETTKLDKALSTNSKSAKSLQDELKQVEKLLKLDPTNTELLAQKQKILSESISTTKEKLDTLRQAQTQVQEQFSRGEISEKQYRALKQEIVATEQQLKGLEAAAKESNLTLQKVADATGKIGEKSEALGKKLLPVSGAVAGLGAASSKAAIDFESAFAGVRKTVNATEDQFQLLSDGIRNMSTEIPTSAASIAELAESAGQLGIKTENILGFTRVVADLGVATNIVGQEGAAQIARFANIVGMSQTDFDKFGSAIVALGNNFATTEGEILEMSMRLAGAGAQVGLSEADILGLATALSSVGIEAEMGGSAISKVMVNMSAAGATADQLNAILNAESMSLRDLEMYANHNSEGFKGLALSYGLTTTELKSLIQEGANLDNFGKIAGMTGEEFRTAFEQDAIGALQAFIQGLGNAESAGSSAIQMLQEMGITEVRLRDSLLRAAGAGDLLTDAVKLSNTAWGENTALTKEAEQRYSTTASQIEIAKNKLVDIGIEIGNMLIPKVTQLLDKLQVLVDWFKNLSDAQKELIVKIGLLVAALAPALIVFGKIATGISDFLLFLPKIAPLLAGIKTAFAGLSAVLLANPIGLIVAAVVALIAGLVLLYNKCEWFRDGVNAIWDGVKTAFFAAWDAIKIFFTETLPAAFRVVVDFVKENWQNLLLLLVNPFAGAFALLYENCEGFRATIDTLLQNIATFFADLWKKIQDTYSGVAEWFSSHFTKAGESITTAFSGVGTFFSDLWQSIKEVFTGVAEWFSGCFIGAYTAIIDAFAPLVEWLTPLIDSIKNLFSAIGEWIVFKFTEAYNETIAAFAALGAWFANLWIEIQAVFAAVGAWFLEKFTEGYNATIAAFANIGQWFAARWLDIQNVFSVAAGWFLQVFQTAYLNVTTTFAAIGQWFAARWMDIQNAFSVAAGWFLQIFQTAYQNITTTFAPVGQWFAARWLEIQTVFAAVGQWFGEKFSEAYNTVVEAFSPIGQWFGEKYKEVTEAFSEIPKFFKDVFDQAVENITQAFSKVLNFFTDIRDKIVDLFNGIADKIRGEISDAQNAADNAGSGGKKTRAYATGGVLREGEGIMAEAGPELIRMVNGAAIITPLSKTAKNTPLTPASGPTLHQTNYFQSPKAIDPYEASRQVRNANQRAVLALKGV